jgi:hypothetical protein
MLAIVMAFLLALTFALPLNVDAAVNPNFTISFEMLGAQPGQQVVIDLYGTNLNDMYAYEAIISYEPQNLEFIKAESPVQGFSMAPKVEGSNIYMAFTKTGKVKGIDGDALLGKISFTRKNSSNISITLKSVKAVASSLSAQNYDIGQSIQTNTSNSGNSSGGSSGSGNESISSTDSGKQQTGTALTLEKYNDLVKNAVADGSGIKTITLEGQAVNGSKEYVQTLPSAALTSESFDKVIVVSTPLGKISLPGNIISKEDVNGKDTVTVSLKVSTNALSNKDAIKLIGQRPIIELTLTSGEKKISSVRQNITLSLPYELKNGEDNNALVVCGIDDKGNAQILQNAAYNPASKAVSFSTGDFSKFSVTYNKINFGDVNEKSYYYDAVTYLAARNILTGTGKDLFSPKSDLTRGQFMVMIMKAYGIMPDTEIKDNFTDAGDTYYTGYLAAAKRLGLSGGIGDNRFAPDNKISRQELLTLLYNILKETGKLKDSGYGKNLNDYSDAGEVAAYAKEAVTFLVKGGFVEGYNNKLTPKEMTGRAQAAQIVFNILTK